MGLTDGEVLNRRKTYGLNQMKEETENLILKCVSGAEHRQVVGRLTPTVSASRFRTNCD